MATLYFGQHLHVGTSAIEELLVDFPFLDIDLCLKLSSPTFLKLLPIFMGNQISESTPTLPNTGYLQCLNSKEVKVNLLQTLQEGTYLWAEDVPFE